MTELIRLGPATLTPAPMLADADTFFAIGLSVMAVIVFGALGIAVARYIVFPAFKGFGLLVAHVFRFIGREIADLLRLAGSLVLLPVYTLLTVFDIVIGRWSAAGHFGKSLGGELSAIGACVYRIVIGHPMKLFGLGGLTEGIEERLPQAVAHAPGPDQPNRRRTGLFDGYRIVGSLPGGGSGGKLYIAEPDEIKLAALERSGHRGVTRVVIKSFSLNDGSTLPQIVRESRSLDAAKRLGLVLDHDLAPDRFFYAMRYVPGQSLTLVTQQLHASSDASAGGLDDANLRRGLGYIADLLATLETYHRGGLWHKDVKPDNIIVDGSHAHLVDFGLVTPLRSAMTLTTHGTEYFRDPEMVRLALRGVKVHEVDGCRFDIYGAGAVLYALIENAFPAHGALSQVTRRCPEAVRWIIRRAMTDYDKRYPTASAMLADLRAVLSASELASVKPGQLPSVQGGDSAPPLEVSPAGFELPRSAAGNAADSPASPPPAPPSPPPMPGRADSPAPAVAPGVRPRVRVTNWWTGEFVVEGANVAPSPADPAGSPAVAERDRRSPAERRSAQAQREHARARVEAARARAQSRIAGRRRTPAQTPVGLNVGVAVASVAFLAFVILAGTGAFRASRGQPRDVVARVFEVSPAPEPPDGVVSLEPGETVAASAGRPWSRAGASRRPKPDPVSCGVLLYQDIEAPVAPTHTRALERIVRTLRERGADVMGRPTWDSLPEEEQRHQARLESEVFAAAGRLGPEHETSKAALSAWLDTAEKVRVIAWVRVAPADTPFTPTGDRPLTVTVITANGADEAERRELRLAAEAVRKAVADSNRRD